MLISCLCFHSGGEEWYLLIYLARVNVSVCENVFIHNVHEGHYSRACVYTSHFVKRPFWMHEGFPIHPTRVNSSLVFVIQLTGYQFENPIPWIRHKSFPPLSIRHAGSRFARDFEHIAPLDNVRWVKNVVDSTRFDRIDTNRTNRLKFVATF